MFTCFQTHCIQIFTRIVVQLADWATELKKLYLKSSLQLIIPNILFVFNLLGIAKVKVFVKKISKQLIKNKLNKFLIYKLRALSLFSTKGSLILYKGLASLSFPTINLLAKCSNNLLNLTFRPNKKLTEL